jgi:hypothetical protein
MYDLVDPFASIPHLLIPSSLRILGLDKHTIANVMAMYDGLSFCINTGEATTHRMPQRSGLKPGDPCSPQLFALCLEILSRRLNDPTLTKDTTWPSHLLFSGNLVTLTSDADHCKAMHACIVEFCANVGISIDVNRCRLSATVASVFILRADDPYMNLYVDGTTIPRVPIDRSFKYLGNIVTIVNRNETAEFDALREWTLNELDWLIDAPFSPRKKLREVRKFVLPCWNNYLRVCGLMKERARLLAMDIRTRVRKMVRLMRTTINAHVYTPTQQGGLSISDSWAVACAIQIDYVIGLLNSQDNTVKQCILNEIKGLVQAHYIRPTGYNMDDAILDLLNSCLTKNNRKPCFKDPILYVSTMVKETTAKVVQLNGHYDVMIPYENHDESVGKSVAQRLMTMFDKRYAKVWQDALLQGRMAATLQHPVANAWMRNRDLARSTFYWAIKARTNTLPVYANLFRWKLARSYECPRAGCKDYESLHHVLSACLPTILLRRERHNEILRLLVAAAIHFNPYAMVTMDKCPPGLHFTQRPDLIIINKKTNHVVIVDVTITSQNSPKCLDNARRRKIEKYTRIANAYIANGYTVDLNAVVFGDVGGTNGDNDYVMQHLIGASPEYTALLHRHCIAIVL